MFSGSQNEQKPLKPFEKNILQDFHCKIFIVTQSIKKLPKEERECALKKLEFRRVKDDSLIDLDKLSEYDKKALFYKEVIGDKRVEKYLVRE